MVLFDFLVLFFSVVEICFHGDLHQGSTDYMTALAAERQASRF